MNLTKIYKLEKDSWEVLFLLIRHSVYIFYFRHSLEYCFCLEIVYHSHLHWMWYHFKCASMCFLYLLSINYFMAENFMFQTLCSLQSTQSQYHAKWTSWQEDTAFMIVQQFSLGSFQSIEIMECDICVRLYVSVCIPQTHICRIDLVK